uniref:Uncharacterized protein n=1 Tax=Steinernema glaseri TaxID=37863 RepID=A0A1I7ZC64_9BILA
MVIFGPHAFRNSLAGAFQAAPKCAAENATVQTIILCKWPTALWPARPVSGVAPDYASTPAKDGSEAQVVTAAIDALRRRLIGPEEPSRHLPVPGDNWPRRERLGIKIEPSIDLASSVPRPLEERNLCELPRRERFASPTVICGGAIDCRKGRLSLARASRGHNCPVPEGPSADGRGAATFPESQETKKRRGQLLLLMEREEEAVTRWLPGIGHVY